MQMTDKFWTGFKKAAAKSPRRSKKFSMFLYKLQKGMKTKFKGHSSKSAFKGTKSGRMIK